MYLATLSLPGSGPGKFSLGGFYDNGATQWTEKSGGSVSELIWYNRALLDSERELVENYLVNKYIDQCGVPVFSGYSSRIAGGLAMCLDAARGVLTESCAEKVRPHAPSFDGDDVRVRWFVRGDDQSKRDRDGLFG